MQSQTTEIAALQKREQELLAQLSIPPDSQINELLAHLKSQHEELLNQQLLQIRRAYIQQFGQQTISITTDKASENSIPSNIVFVQSPGGSNIRLLEEGTSAELSDGSVAPGRIVVMKAEEFENGSDNEAEGQVHDATDNGTSELVISTDNVELVKGDAAKMDDSIETNVPETTVFEDVGNETVVQVTLSGTSVQQADTDDKPVEQTTEKVEVKEPESSPRTKRRKKSH